MSIPLDEMLRHDFSLMDLQGKCEVDVPSLNDLEFLLDACFKIQGRFREQLISAYVFSCLPEGQLDLEFDSISKVVNRAKKNLEIFEKKFQKLPNFCHLSKT